MDSLHTEQRRLESSLEQRISRSKRRAPRYQPLRLWFIVGLILTSVYVAAQQAPVSSYLIYLALLIGFGAFCVFCIRHWSFSSRLGRIDFLEIPIYLSLLNILGIAIFGLAPYYYPALLSLMLKDVSQLPISMVIIGIGLVSMWMGYGLAMQYFYRRLPFQSKFSELFGKPKVVATMLLYVLVVLYRIWFTVTSGGLSLGRENSGGSWNQWLVYVAELRWLFLALIALQVFSKRWPATFLILSVIVESLFSVISGWNVDLILIAICLMACYAYSKGYIPWRIIVVSAILLFFSIPPVRALRDSGISNKSLIERISGLVNTTDLTWGQGNGLDYVVDLLLRRQASEAQIPTVIAYLVPRVIDYRPIQNLLIAPFTFIPRVLWPTKPIYTYGIWVNQVLEGKPAVAATSSAVTIPGDAYLYGGWTVLIAGMFILGLVSAWFYAQTAARAVLSRDVGLLALYAAVIPTTFALGEGGFAVLWGAWIQQVIIYALVLLLLTNKEKVS